MRPFSPTSIMWPDKVDSSKILKSEKNCHIWSQPLDDGTPAIIKMYCGRGLFTFLRGKVSCFRVQREYDALKTLERGGISCSRPLFCSYGYSRKFGFYEILATRAIPNATSLATALESRFKNTGKIDLSLLFQTVRSMHECGVYHGRLSPKNILIETADSTSSTFFIIDMAHARLFSASIWGKKIAWYDLLQLVSKLERYLGAGFCRPFLATYGLGEKHSERLYFDPGYSQTLSRSQKRDKIIFKVKAFVAGIEAKLQT